MGSAPDYHYSYTIFFLFFVLTLFNAFSISANTFSATKSLTITSNKTIISPNEIFELGFFNPASSSRWYLGIWYKKIPTRTYVWVANRDNPLSNSNGTLKISDNNLVIFDQSDTPAWSTNLTGGDVGSPVVAELLDTGNLVIRDSNNPDRFLWQSFDFPTDTLLPEMKLGWDLKTGIDRLLSSWKAPDDPSSGDFSTKLQIRGFPEFYVSNRENILYRSGPWNGIGFSSVPVMKPLDYLVYNFTATNEEVTYSYRITKTNIYSRLSLSSAGLLQRLTWIESAQSWKQLWYSPKDMCDNYKQCGNFGYCDSNTSPVCNCIKGFELRNQQTWALRDDSAGCVRKARLSCDGRDGFLRLKNLKLPDTKATTVDRSIGVKECEEKCLKDCNCKAFANADIRDGGSGCVIWTGEILDIRNFAKGGQDLYVRLAAADLEDKETKNIKIIGSSIGVSILLLLSFIIFRFWKRKYKRSIAFQTPDGMISFIKIPSLTGFYNNFKIEEFMLDPSLLEEDFNLKLFGIYRVSKSSEKKKEKLELPLMEFEAISRATNNFSNANKLGQGGFGIVYKGRLDDGREIAVKRLSKMSLQGTNEFKNEVRLIARLQHMNLVRLLGCCVDKGEKMLIYEYLENLSLDSHLFDFGMARIFGQDETEANTRKVVGTYGYMSPEYAMDGLFSMKSDVFSFGVLLLEIISGKKNNGFYNSNRDLNLLGCLWRHWKEGSVLEIVDPIIIDSSSSTCRTHEILRYIQIGLLCVQERAEDRPVMSSVMLMLGSETTVIPQPKRPGYCVGRSLLETDSSSSTQHNYEWTVNQITLSVIDAR
ncbi:hypothetical protein EUTSA_v10018108mg [Eutrema salsugineum]|uniref:Receptor-like serine/threonine-protein kinase n=1 Tax=Eutrema salsugineum TaxID=72664 RepID=V4MBM7_EUTSA|nr:hypothetical protein EUTSA_v10018108mg [Eutrema salsugineum]